MKYINKQIASDTAFNMLKSTRDKIESKEKELSDFCEKLVIDSIPVEEYELVCKLPEGWIQRVSSWFYFSTEYGNSIKACTTNQIKYKYNSYTIKIKPEEYEKIKELQAIVKEMNSKKDSISEQIIATLLKLRTAEKIKKEFPEAYKNLPKDSMQEASNILALPIEKILSNIDKFPE